LQDALNRRKEKRHILLERIVDALQTDDRFVAAWLTGSLARAADPRFGGDGLSDIDLTVVVRDHDFETLGVRPWMVDGWTIPERLELFRRFGEPVIIHENHHNAPNEGTFTIVIYADDAFTVDWTLVSESKASLPSPAAMLFNRTGHSFDKKRGPTQSRQERAQFASEKVAFFWMMLAVAVKYMLRRDIVFFHMLIDSIERTFAEVSWLVEGRSWTHHSGSRVKLAVTQREQVSLVRVLATRMLALMQSVVEIGGVVPDDPMRAIDQLLAFSPADESTSETAITEITLADREKVRTMVNTLEHIGKRPGMYIGSNDPQLLQVLLDGIQAGASLFGLYQSSDSNYHSVYEQVMKARGWSRNSRPLYMHLRDHGLSDDAIIQEMIAVKIEVLKRSYGL
jgi:predicted nucleotidyltransferase